MHPSESPSVAKRYGSLLIAGLLIITGVGAALLITSPPRGDPIILAEPADLRVHVAGAVHRPGVYELPFDSIVQQAIEAAGGFTEVAAQDRINLAATLEDGQQVYVPDLSEPAPLNSNPANSGEPVAINLATAPELERLPGIGPVLAQRIVEYREQNGPYQRLEDLLEVEGIGPSKLESLKDYVQVP